MNHIFLLSIRSLTKNIDEPAVLTDSLHEAPAIICLTKTWFSPHCDTDIFNIKGYRKIFHCDREKRGGGVAIFVKTKWKSSW